jgi:phasin
MRDLPLPAEPAALLEPAPVEATPVEAPVAMETPAPLLPEAPAVQAAIAETVEAPKAAAKDMGESVRGIVEKGLVETRARYALAKSAAEEAAAAVEKSYGAAQSGVAAINLKAMEAIQAGAQANFDLMKALASAKSVSEVVSLQGEFARKRFEDASARAKEMAELTRKVAEDATAPIKAHVAKTFKVAV